MTKPAVPSRRYHHGNLRQALLDATLDLADEKGLEQVSLREVARRVGVSSGAPFRHFQDATRIDDRHCGRGDKAIADQS